MKRTMPAEELVAQTSLDDLAAGADDADAQRRWPAVTARPHRDGFFLDGVMPWVTGAARADHFVTGAVLDDGRQVLLVVPRDAEGLSVREPLDLMALQGSLTTSVDCRQVFVGQ